MAPLFFLLIVGTIEVGRALEASQMILITVREGARLAATDYASANPELKATNANVEADIRNYLAAAGIPIDDVTISITDAETGAPLTFENKPPNEYRLYRISVTVPYTRVGYITPFFLKNYSLTQSIVMREGHKT